LRADGSKLQAEESKADGCRLQVDEPSSNAPHFNNQRATNILQLLRTLIAWFVTFHLVTALWLTFLMPDMASIGAFFQGVCSGKTGFVGPPIFSLLFYGTAVVAYHVWGWIKEHREALAAKLSTPVPEGIVHGVMLFLIITNPGAPRGFIYFQF
jgi:alginate O-acetyltransferase complex protein AlgI